MFMRQIPTITKNLLIINCICYLAAMVFSGRGIDLNDVFGLHYFQAQDFGLYQFVTYMFMHASLTHLFFNMFALWMFGGVIERTFGQKRFLIYYMVCGLGAALCQELSQFVQIYSMIADQGASLSDMMNLSAADRMTLNHFTTVGASGSIYGILLAFGMSFPEERMFIFPLPVPIKAKWFVCGYVVIELLSALSQRGDGVAHVAHLGGMLFGYVLIRMWQKHSSSFNGWDGYEIKDSSATILGKIRKWLRLDGRKKDNYNRNYKASSRNQQDWDYNARKKQREKELDNILDKVKRSGYNSLTEEEKKRLFDNK